MLKLNCNRYKVVVVMCVSDNSNPVPVAHLQQGDKLIRADGHDCGA